MYPLAYITLNVYLNMRVTINVTLSFVWGGAEGIFVSNDCLEIKPFKELPTFRIVIVTK